MEELPEQLMSCVAMQHYKQGEKNLEIGCNIGDNTLILSYLIGSENIIAIDACFEYTETCKQNLQNAGFSNCKVIPVAISNMPLKRMHWKTSEHEPFKPLEQDYEYVYTMKWNEFNSIHGPFDIVVADYEGSVYKIIQENDN